MKITEFGLTTTAGVQVHRSKFKDPTIFDRLAAKNAERDEILMAIVDACPVPLPDEDRNVVYPMRQKSYLPDTL